MVKFIWNYETELALESYVGTRIHEGVSVKQATTEFALEHSISESAVSQKYYKLIRDDTIRRIPGSKVDIDNIITQLEKLKSLQAAVSDLQETIQRKDATINKLENKVSKLEEFEDEYKKLLSALDQHRRQTSVFKQEKNGNLERLN